MIYYRQCTLHKDIHNGTKIQVAWIPDKYSKVGGLVKIKRDDDSWEAGWEVVNRSDEKIEEKQLPDYRRMIRGHRAKTGDSLRKAQQ